MNQCQWRGCNEPGHPHGGVSFKVFGIDKNKVEGIYLCREHCKQAKRTRHLDVMISQIRMEPRAGA